MIISLPLPSAPLCILDVSNMPVSVVLIPVPIKGIYTHPFILILSSGLFEDLMWLNLS